MGVKCLGELGCLRRILFSETIMSALQNSVSQDTEDAGVVRYWFARWYWLGFRAGVGNLFDSWATLSSNI